MTPTEIKVRMLLFGVKQVRIAERLGVYPSAVHNVISGFSRAEKVERAIANEIGMDRDEIFPVIRGKYTPEHVVVST
jgi:hypothetical protein